jgi:hypothetical protein
MKFSPTRMNTIHEAGTFTATFGIIHCVSPTRPVESASKTDSGSPADDGTGGGCIAAGVDGQGNPVPDRVKVTADPGNAVTAFALNSLFALSNTANHYFSFLTNNVGGGTPSYMHDVPTSSSGAGRAAEAAVFVGTVVAGLGGEGGRVIRIIEEVPGQHRDEYPPAMTQQGGTGASVRPVSPSDNTGAGASMGDQMRPYPDGTTVKIVPTNVPKPPPPPTPPTKVPPS